MDDKINPKHYKKYGVEAIDVLEAQLVEEGMVGYLKGNVFKYIFRVGSKGHVVDWLADIDKAIWYLERLKQVYKNHRS